MRAKGKLRLGRQLELTVDGHSLVDEGGLLCVLHNVGHLLQKNSIFTLNLSVPALQHLLLFLIVNWVAHAEGRLLERPDS